ncbi:MAG: V-type ATP synthase subunit D [Spirochaetes bacterium]|nr:V-type ATP synthase subunit D [Spirochaetota bacterium]
MSKLKLTKNELKRQKDDLKRFNRYLPTLLLKKQQLQFEIQTIEARHMERLTAQKNIEQEVLKWVDVFGEETGIEHFIKFKSVITDTGNVAGIDIPIFRDAEFEVISYDLFFTPLWVDRAVKELIKIYRIIAELKVFEKQMELLKDELRITSQRVNLFEKVKIPEAKRNIRVIQIYMGDQQTAAVVRGKIAKNKIVQVQS